MRPVPDKATVKYASPETRPGLVARFCERIFSPLGRSEGRVQTARPRKVETARFWLKEFPPVAG